MYVTRHRVTVGPTAAGAATGYTDIANGYILAIRYTKVDFSNGVDFDVTLESSGVVVWDQDNVNATATVYPRAATHDTAGAAALYAAGGTAVTDRIPVAQERIAIAVSSAGNNTTGTFDVYVGG